MQWIKNIAIILWRIWFYIVLTIVIVLFSPLLIILVLKETWYPYFFKIARIWAKVILFSMGFRLKIKKEEDLITGKSYMLIANHTSMIDIMMMLYIIKEPFVFVGKQELAKFPIFGFFYKRTCILVDRTNAKSKQAVFEQAQRRLNQGISICIFPEGGVPDDETIVLDTFRDGAFRLAIDHQIPVVPMVFYDNKKHFSYTFISGKPGTLRGKIKSFIETHNMSQQDKKELRQKAFDIIERELITQQF
ncbi:lysophospholipid acyltransferase family protein [Gangjinia marincola]|uniref:1-acyl-sn-glycerol-3-phosphate acyltransferase n=1 Tax=Gangjinia marincola TaxID=578463 RepID=A0ABN1MHZ3_9FLAO